MVPAAKSCGNDLFFNVKEPKFSSIQSTDLSATDVIMRKNGAGTSKCRFVVYLAGSGGGVSGKVGEVRLVPLGRSRITGHGGGGNGFLMANHASTRTTQLHDDRRSDDVTLAEVERIIF